MRGKYEVKQILHIPGLVLASIIAHKYYKYDQLSTEELKKIHLLGFDKKGRRLLFTQGMKELINIRCKG